MVKKIVAIAISLIALVGLGYLLTSVVGKPISNDLSIIGKGKPVLVLAYENYSPTGGEALNNLSYVIHDYDSQLHFVVADLGIPQGRTFANRHNLIDGQAIFMKQDGRPVRVTRIPEDEQELRSLLDSTLSAMK
jgi:hypothetical protein